MSRYIDDSARVKHKRRVVSSSDEEEEEESESDDDDDSFVVASDDEVALAEKTVWKRGWKRAHPRWEELEMRDACFAAEHDDGLHVRGGCAGGARGNNLCAAAEAPAAASNVSDLFDGAARRPAASLGVVRAENRGAWPAAAYRAH